MMHGAVLYGPGDVRFEERDDPKILNPTDAIIRLPVTCVCGSDLWPYRGLQPIDGPTPMGHEYCGRYLSRSPMKRFGQRVVMSKSSTLTTICIKSCCISPKLKIGWTVANDQGSTM